MTELVERPQSMEDNQAPQAAEQAADLQAAAPQEAAPAGVTAEADQQQRKLDEERARQGVELHASASAVENRGGRLSPEAVRAQPASFAPGHESAAVPPWEQAPDTNAQPSAAHQETPLSATVPGAYPDQQENERLIAPEPAPPVPGRHAAETNQPGFMRKVRSFFSRRGGGRHT